MAKHWKKLAVAAMVAGISSVSFAADSLEIGVRFSDRMPRALNKVFQVLNTSSKFFSERMGEQVIVMPERSATLFKNYIRTNRYPVIYVSSDLAAIGEIHGYRGLLTTSKKVDSVVLTRADAPIADWQDLYGKKILSAPFAQVTQVGEAAMYQTGVIGLVNSESKNVATLRDLFDIFSSGDGDAIVVAKSFADQVIDQNPNKYKIALRAGTFPSHILMVSKNLPEDVVKRIEFSFMELNREENSKLAGFFENDMKPGYKKYEPSDLDAIRAVLKIVEPDAFPAPAPAK